MANFRGRGLMQQNRENINRVNDMTVKVTRVSGRVLVSGAGEASVDVKFPVRFGERPSFSFGGELEPGSPVRAGRYPTVSAVVGAWDQRDAVEGGTDGYFVGATLLIVTTGSSEQAMWVHWSMEAKAVRNPINNLDTTDGTL